jgi:hypothetical protein
MNDRTMENIKNFMVLLNVITIHISKILKMGNNYKI